MDPNGAEYLGSFVDPVIYGVCAFLSVLSVFGILAYAIKLKNSPYTSVLKKIIVSAGIGFLFWITQLLFYTSLRVSVSPDGASIAFLPIFILLLFILIQFIDSRKAGRRNTYHYARVCLYMTIALLAADYAGFYPIYAGQMDWNILLMIICAAIVVGTVFSGAQLLFLILDEESIKSAFYWGVAGSVLIGSALSVIPYMVIFSVVSISDQHHPFVLLPYTIGLISMAALEFIPSYYSYRKLNVKKEEYASLYQNNLDAVFTLDPSGIITGCNRAAVLLTGYSEKEVEGESYSLIGRSEEISKMYKKKAIAGEAFSVEVNIRKKDGSLLTAIASVISITAHGKATGIYVILKDVTEIKKAEQTIQQLAYYDDLTGLPNLKRFRDLISTFSEPYTLLSIEIVNLLSIEELYGERAADEVIKAAAGKLKTSMPEGSILAITDTGVFSLVLFGKKPEDLNRNNYYALEKPVCYKETVINITAAAGAAIYPMHSKSHEEVFKYANMALNVAKNRSTERQLVFSNELNEEYHKALYMENELRKAIQEEELFVHYQPKFNLESGQFNSAEALVRWVHPELGFISPGVFIPIAEKKGLIPSLEKFVLKTAFLQMRKWKQSGYPFQRVAVNFSHYHFYDDGIVDTVKEVLGMTGLNPECAEIEITESAMIENKDDTIRKLNELKKLGIKISLDDFGTGYSSLSYLQELPIDVLKIDRSFINKINSSRQSNAILSSIISMARDLDLEIVAEGVETKEQLDFLDALHCPSIQGFYFSPPLSPADLDKIVYKTTFS
ncbi:phosphodiesterase [Bacillus sp. FJAT-42376]|uniref:sensor domain-containing protein n=1 Tax=Bacillus sp. FJAT-42376 TaxID=2014076 RepID=UPI000F4E5C2F|nr:GGDEF domain-containing phosphodiesterase [Bacillus sp. FJAT-42376]AZB41598.1 phosphodiesterase [Bacillus sp. FJAT-42376]